MKTETKAAGKAPETRCDSLCGGQYQHGLALAKRHGASVESAEREHRTVHELTRKRLAGPGGAVVQVAELAGMEHQLREAEARLDGLLANGCKEASERVKEQRSQIHNLKNSLAERKAFMADLPPEALADPRQAVGDAEAELARARAARDLPAIRDAAAKLDTAKARQAGAAAERVAVGAEIQKVAGRAYLDLARSLTAALTMIGGKVGGLTADPAFLEAPELIDIKSIEALWREAGAVEQAILLIGYNADLWSVMNSVPAGLVDHLAGALGLGTSGRVRENVA